MPTAHIVARFIVQNADGPISNLKLQKLLYYVQGWYLGINGKPVFDQEVQAWVHGPVVPAVFRLYRDQKWNPIPVDPVQATLDEKIAQHTLAILKTYGTLTAAQLENISHNEAPWIEARGNLGPKEPSRAVIPHESMKRFFGMRARGK